MDNVVYLDTQKLKMEGLKALSFLQSRTEQTNHMMETLTMPLASMEWFIEWYQQREAMRQDMFDFTGKIDLNNKNDIQILKEKINIILEHEKEIYRKIADS